MRAVFLSPMSLLIVATRESRSNGRGLFNDWFVQLQRHFPFFLQFKTVDNTFRIAKNRFSILHNLNLIRLSWRIYYATKITFSCHFIFW